MRYSSDSGKTWIDDEEKAYNTPTGTHWGSGRRAKAVCSGGLWGIESDSNESYLKEIENEQVEELIYVLKVLNVKTELLEKWLAERGAK